MVNYLVTLLNRARKEWLIMGFREKTLTKNIIHHHEIEKELSKRQQNISYHLSPTYEKIALHYIQNGQINQIKAFLQQPLEGKPGILSKKSRIRSEKNNVIAWITLACRAAIAGGLNHETALTMSDLYIIRLEDLYTIAGIQQLGVEATYHFTEKVNQLKVGHYSHTINLCKEYIFKNLYEEINLSQLSEATNLNASYLSYLFNKEVGMTIMKYVQQQKIEEAKTLLQLTKHSLSEISSWLHFYDQSHFTKVFKQYTGKTPRQFRNQMVSKGAMQ